MVVSKINNVNELNKYTRVYLFDDCDRVEIWVDGEFYCPMNYADKDNILSLIRLGQLDKPVLFCDVYFDSIDSDFRDEIGDIFDTGYMSLEQELCFLNKEYYKL